MGLPRKRVVQDTAALRARVEHAPGRADRQVVSESVIRQASVERAPCAAPSVLLKTPRPIPT